MHCLLPGPLPGFSVFLPVPKQAKSARLGKTADAIYTLDMYRQHKLLAVFIELHSTVVFALRATQIKYVALM